jgi:LPS export ABC transporter permease LptG/LPS export ABC transporter permease LptF
VSAPGLRVLDRYVLRELLGPFFLALVLFTFFFLIDRIYLLTDLVITTGVPLPLVLQLVVYMLPSFVALSLPMALLVAVLLAGGRLAGDFEIVACQAAGIGLGRLLRPVLMGAVVVALIGGLFSIALAPLAAREFKQQLFKILRTRAVSGIKERVFNTTFPGITVYVADVSPSGMALRSVLVSDERDPKLSRIITAPEGRLLTDEGDRRITLRLAEGAVNEADVAPVTAPTEGPTPTSGSATAARYRYSRFAVYDMVLPLDSTVGSLRAVKPEKDLTYSALRTKLAQLRGDPAARAPFLVEWHKRAALPIAALVFTILGFPLAVRSLRGGRSVALVGSLVILVSYYLLLTALEGSALRLRLPAWVAIWAPNALFGAVGLAVLIATARGRRLINLTPVWRALAAALGRLPARPTLRWRRRPWEPRESTHIIDRYLIRQFLAYTGTGLAVVAALFVVIDIMKELDGYLRIKPSILHILEHLVYRAPAEIHKSLPIVMLVATIFLFLGLSRYHELTAMKAAGVSLYRVSAPILGMGLLMAVGAALFQELVLPKLNELGHEVDRIKIRGQQPRHLQTLTRLWLRSADSRFYRVELVAPSTGELYGMTLLELDRDFRLARRLDAQRAHWTASGWNLRDGATRHIDPDGHVETAAFTATIVTLPETIEDFTASQKLTSAMSYRELRDYVTRLEAAGFQVRRYLVDLYAKLSSPLENLIMVLIAIPFALQSPRGGRLFGIGLAIAIMGCYLAMDRMALAFARAEILPPLLGAWTANIIFLGIGAALFVRART